MTVQDSPRPGGRKAPNQSSGEREQRAASANTVVKPFKISKKKDLMPARDSRDEYEPGQRKSRNRQPSLDSTTVSNQQFRNSKEMDTIAELSARSKGLKARKAQDEKRPELEYYHLRNGGSFLDKEAASRPPRRKSQRAPPPLPDGNSATTAALISKDGTPERALEVRLPARDLGRDSGPNEQGSSEDEIERMAFGGVKGRRGSHFRSQQVQKRRLSMFVQMQEREKQIVADIREPSYANALSNTLICRANWSRDPMFKEEIPSHPHKEILLYGA